MTDRANSSVPVNIKDEAVRWIADMEGRNLRPEEQRHFDEWLAADERHARAYSEMLDIWHHLGAVPDSPALRANLPRPGQLQRGRPRIRISLVRGGQRAPRRWVGAAVAACVALIIVGTVQDWPTRLRADALTETGETRLVSLPDGSRIRIGTNSAVAYDFTEKKRSVTLIKGEAVFTVARDPTRLFEVEAAGGTTTALGTQFLVRHDGDKARVVVTEHSVRVVMASPDRMLPSLSEGQAVRYGPEGFGPVATVNAADAIAWTDGALIFKNTPLEDVVSEISRYRRGYLHVAPNARAIRVSGVFHIDNPDAAIEQLRQSFGLKITRYTEWLTTIAG